MPDPTAAFGDLALKTAPSATISKGGYLCRNTRLALPWAAAWACGLANLSDEEREKYPNAVAYHLA